MYAKGRVVFRITNYLFKLSYFFPSHVWQESENDRITHAPRPPLEKIYYNDLRRTDSGNLVTIYNLGTASTSSMIQEYSSITPPTLDGNQQINMRFVSWAQE